MPSVIDHPDAGFGVYVSGSCPAGAVVAIYAGHVYNPSFNHDNYFFWFLLSLTFQGNVSREVCENNEYLISRYDGTIIDGNWWDKLADDARMKKRGYEHLGSELAFNIADIEKRKKPSDNSAELLTYVNRFRNPFGIASFVNHPPLLDNEYWDEAKKHPKSALSNVMSISFDFTEDEWSDKELTSYIPHERKG